jgi:hypothetical protein
LRTTKLSLRQVQSYQQAKQLANEWPFRPDKP